MKRTTRILCAGCVSAAAILSTSGSALAVCQAGDLAGKWSMYAIGLATFGGTTMYQTQACTVTLTNYSSSPITYSIAGTCKAYSGATVGSGTISGTGTITENATCRLGGNYVVSGTGPSQTVQIVDARIENQTKKGNINGVGRVNMGGGQFLDLRFTLTR